MSAAPKVSHVTPKQHAADKANLARARAAQRRSGALHHHTAKQKAASRANLVKARAAQKSRRAGKTPVKPKAAAAPLAVSGLPPPGTASPGLSDLSLAWAHSGQLRDIPHLHELPACGPVALAEHLATFTGIRLPDESVLALHDQAGIVSLAELLERVAAEGLAGPGTRLAHFERCDPDAAVPGLIYGISLPGLGYHAVLLHPAGMMSWGQLLPLAGTPAEAWWLEWEAE